MRLYRAILLTLLIGLQNIFLFAHRPNFLFSPNKGQWHANVLYRTHVPGGEMYLERDGITFRYYDKQKLKWIHDNKGKPMETPEDNLINGVTVRTKLLNANIASKIQEETYTKFYENFFLGNDPSKHATAVYPATKLEYGEVYRGIDWIWYEKDGFLKYDFNVKKGADPSQIKIRYSGQNKIHIDDKGNLITTTYLNVLKEEKPVAFQVNSRGDTVFVRCEYVVIGDVVSYHFPEGYNKAADLIIDPTLIFSTYSGSFADNFGFTATYDSKGFLYSGGNVFAAGYNVTPGAFQMTYGAGNIDCAITKYDTTGTFMIWSTYLGGSGSEMPHSMVVNKLNQLFVYGTTGSLNFPTTPNAYDQSYNGGTSLTSTGVGYTDANGSDIFISKFSVDGTQLLASTYLGGSGNDGLNLGPVLNHNYADLSRGEIDIDNSNAIYLASSTASSNFPTTAGAPQPNFGGGGFDGVVLKMDNSLTTLIWSTFLGGTNNDAVYSLAIDKANSIIVCGGSNSTDFPVTGSTFNTPNGNVDAFITKINSAGTQIVSSILYGTPTYNQAYFVELDASQNVYILGQSDATNGYFNTGTGFGNANGNMFITKFNKELDTRLWSTAFGNQNGFPDISPTAFLVDVCRKIYLSGWGGQVNASNVPGSTVSGLPITGNAYQSSTNGSDFYIMVLEDDASSLTYGTYYGGQISPEHVDGGTSRFNRRGEIYQSVCAGCGSNDDFPIWPSNAWSPTNNSFNCNNGVFKMSFNFPNVLADFDVPPSACAPVSMTFPNYSSGATDYFWDLGNGQTSTSTSPTANYSQPGVYTIMLVANNNTGTTCNVTDTIYKQITVLGLSGQALPPVELCNGENQEIGVPPTSDPSISYLWIPSTGLSDPTAPNPIFSGSAGSQNYQLIVSNSVCTDTLTQTVTVSSLTPLSLNDTLVCAGEIVFIGFPNPPQGMTFSWSPANLLSSATVSNPAFVPQNTQTFSLVYGYPGCTDTLTRTINVLNLGFFNPSDTAICVGDTVQVNDVPLVPGVSYSWSPANWVSNPNIHNPLLFPPLGQTFTLIISNSVCADTVQKNVGILLNAADAGIGDTICVGQSVVIGPTNPSNFLAYNWSPTSGLNNPNIPNPTASPAFSTSYILNTHALGNPNKCTDSDTVTIVVSDPGAPGFAFSEFIGCYGAEVFLNANGNSAYQYNWFISGGPSGNGTSYSFVVPFDTTVTFNMVVTGEGCTDTVSVTKTFEGFDAYWGSLDVPNIFTPNGDNVNDCFAPKGAPEGCYRLYVYNRWGVLMFDSVKLEKSCWNGKYMKTDNDAVDGVYFWVLEIGHNDYHGTVTLTRGNQ
ncbi:MAG: gliding motility-associated C-terminal domain-containing protein [Flavobacteriales bacterium]|nr:gliding motility-associated C-terminal domain-containing protein [Flavobacteriales bacterium]